MKCKITVNSATRKLLLFCRLIQFERMANLSCRYCAAVERLWQPITINGRHGKMVFTIIPHANHLQQHGISVRISERNGSVMHKLCVVSESLSELARTVHQRLAVHCIHAYQCVIILHVRTVHKKKVYVFIIVCNLAQRPRQHNKRGNCLPVY